jgi:TatD DNase family protein
MIAVGGNDSANEFALDTAANHPRHVCPAVGMDRYTVDDCSEVQSCLAQLKETLHQAGSVVVALGEIGLDFHHNTGNRDAQIELFRAQLRLAAEAELPVIVHSRDAEAETLEELEHHTRNVGNSGNNPGVLHCFTGTADFARQVCALGFFVSFSGIVTFKKADGVRHALQSVPDERLLIETDSPYLSPEPRRGKPNEPANVKLVAERIAAERNTSPETVAELTTSNSRRLFRLPL